MLISEIRNKAVVLAGYPSEDRWLPSPLYTFSAHRAPILCRHQPLSSASHSGAHCLTMRPCPTPPWEIHGEASSAMLSRSMTLCHGFSSSHQTPLLLYSLLVCCKLSNLLCDAHYRQSPHLDCQMKLNCISSYLCAYMRQQLNKSIGVCFARLAAMLCAPLIMVGILIIGWVY